MKNKNINKKFSIKYLIPVLIPILVFEIVLFKPANYTDKKELIKQHNEENLINISGRENQQILLKIIHKSHHNNFISSYLLNKPLIIKYNHDIIICLKSINKHPRWSKSTFS